MQHILAFLVMKTSQPGCVNLLSLFLTLMHRTAGKLYNSYSRVQAKLELLLTEEENIYFIFHQLQRFGGTTKQTRAFTPSPLEKFWFLCIVYLPLKEKA
jgi:hypothetical protein